MDFGVTPEGTPVDLYELSNGRMTVKVITYGAIVTEIHVPDRAGSSRMSCSASTTSATTWPATRISGP